MSNTLVLSGGGSKGAYQVGVIQALEHLKVPMQRAIGVSVGAVNAAGYAAGGIEPLKQLWLGIESNRDIQRMALHKLWNARGVYHFGPLRDMLKANLPDHITDYRITPSAVYYDLSARELRQVTPTAGKDEFIEAIIASSSLAFFHEPPNGTYVDAGHWAPIPIDLGIRESHHGDYVIAVGTEPLTKPADDWVPSIPYPATIGLRAVDVMFDRIYQEAYAKHRGNEYVVSITPEFPLEIGGMEYEPHAISETMEQGYYDTLARFKESVILEKLKTPR